MVSNSISKQKGGIQGFKKNELFMFFLGRFFPVIFLKRGENRFRVLGSIEVFVMI